MLDKTNPLRTGVKLSKEQVHYGRGMQTAYCGKCAHYLGHRCEIVAGLIEPDMWCAYFETENSLLTDTRFIQLIRHGATKLNNDDVSVDRIRGWSNVPLSPDGHEEAIHLGDRLRTDPPMSIIASDLLRASETAEIISRLTKAPLVEKTKAFRPWNVGDYTGKLTSDCIPILEDHTKHPNKPLPGGESFNSFKRRFMTGLLYALNKHHGMIALVTHHRGERLLKAWKAGRYSKINLAEFNKRGEHTGSAEGFMIPMDKLRAMI
jgi:alpha-ribazole phosphatase